MVEERIRRALRDLRLFVIFDLESDERYEIRTHPRFPTACWRWDDKEKKHKILIGLGGDLAEQFAEHPEYMKSFGYHEIAHSLYSERDLRKVKEELERKDLPFPLYNLFEDARIEHLWRKEFGFGFDWAKYEGEKIEKKVREWLREMGQEMTFLREWKESGRADGYIGAVLSPEDVFLWIVQYEGHPIEILRVVDGNRVEVKIGGRVKEFDIGPLTGAEAKEYEELVGEFLDRIYEYYRRVISVSSFEEMVEVMKEWTEEFGTSRPHGYPQLLPTGRGEDAGGGEANPGELEVSAEDTYDISFSQLWGEAKDSEDRTTGEEEETFGMGERGDRDEEEKVEGDEIVPSEDPVVINWEAVEVKVRKLLRAFKSYTRKVNTVIPSKRIDPKRLSLERDDIYVKKEEVSFGVRPFTILVDCSASMRKMTPEQHVLTAVFSELARKTGTEAYAIFTRTSEAQLFKLPMKREDIERIPYDGASENIFGGLEEFERYILRTKFLFIISDMQITDYWSRTQEKIRQLKRKGIEVIGIYKGEYYDEAKENAPQFFDRYAVTRESDPIDLLIPILKTVIVRGR